MYTEVVAVLSSVFALACGFISAHKEGFLVMGCTSGSTWMVRLGLLFRVDVNKPDPKHGFTYLYYATVLGEGGNNTKVVNILLAEGAAASIDSFGKATCAPLYEASGRGRLDIVNALIAAGADVNKTNSTRYTPLYFACEKGFTDVAMTLLKAGADPSLQGMNEYTPLAAAAKNNHGAVVKFLRDAGVKR